MIEPRLSAPKRFVRALGVPLLLGAFAFSATGVVPANASPRIDAAVAGKPSGSDSRYPRVPTISDAVTGGSRTGAHWHALGPDIVSKYGYTETEYFASGTASNLGRDWSGIAANPGSATPQTADYKTSVVVLRPADPRDFNGRTIVEWANASATFDLHLVTTTAHRHLMEQGYAVVTVTAQPISIDSPVGLKAWDPVRYGSLKHPGEQFNQDIFGQIAASVKQDPKSAQKLLGGLKTKTLVGFGSSQSCVWLVPFTNVVQAAHPVFDSMLLIVCNAVGLNTSVVKTLLVTGEDERSPSGPGPRGESPPPTKSFRTWQMAGAAHVDRENSSLIERNIARDQTAGNTGTWPSTVPFDYETNYQYGELLPASSPGTCGRSFYPQRFAFAAGMEAVSAWVKGGAAPKDLRLKLVAPGGPLARDAFGNAIGGFRSPVVDVPIATYTGDVCGGITTPFDSARIAKLYPSHSAYVKKMQKATTKAVAKRQMTVSDGCQLMTRAVRSSIGGNDVYKRPIPECKRRR